MTRRAASAHTSRRRWFGLASKIPISRWDIYKWGGGVCQPTPISKCLSPESETAHLVKHTKKFDITVPPAVWQMFQNSTQTPCSYTGTRARSGGEISRLGVAHELADTYPELAHAPSQPIIAYSDAPFMTPRKEMMRATSRSGSAIYVYNCLVWLVS